MKKILIYFLFLICSYDVWSQRVPVSLARDVAINHMKKRGIPECEIKQLNVIGHEGDTCLYMIFFDNNLWYLVSADKRAKPIVAYGNNYNTLEDIPEAMVDIISSYEKQITDLTNKSDTAFFIEENPLWHVLLNSTKAFPVVYQQSEILLDRTNKGKIKWGQYGNNDHSCIPSYNDACEYDSDCDCSHKPVGCGAVAMGMVMWYWQWPRLNSEIHCRWELIPSELKETTPTDEVYELTNFLRDCGEKVNMTYWCTGAWCTISDINSALHDLGYKSSIYHRANSWSTNAWHDLIKSEIDNNRPVIYYGQPGISFWEGHYFVLDGYNEDDKFHINFGHKGNYNGWFYLDGIVEGNTNYNSNQYAIVGISPKYNDIDITHLPYNIIPYHQWRTEYAFNTLSVPSSGNTLIAQNGGEVLFEAGHEIVLNPGFEACNGSFVEARINPNLLSHMDISIPYLPNAVIWGGTGYNIYVTNADSWEFVMKNINTDPVFFSAGTIDSYEQSLVNLWDGSGGLYEFLYYGNIRFKNSYGREMYIDDFLIAQRGSYSNQQFSEENHDSINYLKPSNCLDGEIIIYPNPSSGLFTVNIQSSKIYTLEVYTTQGVLVFSNNNIGTNIYILDLSGISPGDYLLVINGTNTKKIIKQ